MDSIRKIIHKYNDYNSTTKENSYENEAKKIIYNCSLCEDTGYILIGEGIDTVAKQCGCRKNINSQNKIKSARISRLMQDCTFDKFDYRYYSKKIKIGNLSYFDLVEKAMEASARFVFNILHDKPTDGLVFIGKTGRGKTYIAASIANEIILRKPNCNILFIVVPDLLNEIRSTYNNLDNSITEYQLIDEARNAEILILDDLGAHNYSDWVKDKLYNIIDYRLQEQLPTIITTNLLDPPMMDAILGERITSRIFQLCKAYRIVCEQDIRLLNSYEQMQNEFDKL